MAQDILLFTKDTCCFQMICSSSKMPINFVEVSLQPVPILHNGTSSITSCLSVRSQDLCLGLITLYLVFLVFNESLLARNHVCSLFMSLVEHFVRH